MYISNIKTFDQKGNLSKIIVEDMLFEKGENIINKAISDLFSGTYIVELKIDGNISTQKLVITK